MKQTILGANGSIGSVLAKELSNYTNEIRLVSRNPKKINENDELFSADLSNQDEVDKAIQGSAIVYLVVGFDYNIKVWQDKWPKLMKATIDACIKYSAKLVFFDNIYLYDISSIGHITENSPINPPSKKGKVRMEIATMIMDNVKSGKLRAIIARAPDFYGADNGKSILLETVFKNIIKGKSPQWFINLNKKHSFIYTPDAAKATAILGNTPDAYNQVWHLPTSKETLNGNEWIALFNKEMNASKKGKVLSMLMIRIVGIFIPFMREMPEMMYQYDRDYFFDSSKFIKKFNFEPTSPSDAVKQIVRQYKK